MDVGVHTQSSAASLRVAGNSSLGWHDLPSSLVLAVLEPVRNYKARQASTLLVFDAVEKALDDIAARREATIEAGR